MRLRGAFGLLPVRRRPSGWAARQVATRVTSAASGFIAWPFNEPRNALPVAWIHCVPVSTS
jgi:hypothetical protein